MPIEGVNECDTRQTKPGTYMKYRLLHYICVQLSAQTTAQCVQVATPDAQTQ